MEMQGLEPGVETSCVWGMAESLLLICFMSIFKSHTNSDKINVNLFFSYKYVM